MPDTATNPLVVDASVSLAWIWDEPGTGAAQQLLRAGPRRLHVPAIWTAEVANALVGRARRGQPAGMLERSWAAVTALPIEIDARADTVPGCWACMELARTHRLTVYNAQYLELALRRRFALATLDRALQAAARTAGVALALA